MQSGELPVFEMRHRLQLALEFGNVSVVEMADYLEVSRTTVSNYLHGRTQPRRRDLRSWALRCGVPFDWIVEGSEVLDDSEDESEAASPKQVSTRRSSTKRSTPTAKDTPAAPARSRKRAPRKAQSG